MNENLKDAIVITVLVLAIVILIGVLIPDAQTRAYVAGAVVFYAVIFAAPVILFVLFA